MAEDIKVRGLPRIPRGTPLPEEVYQAFEIIEERLDMIQNVRGWHKARRVSDDSAPTPNADEVILWHDTVNDKLYLVGLEPDTGTGTTVKKVELT